MQISGKKGEEMNSIKGEICGEPNKYGFRYQVNHPWVKNLYNEYRKRISEFSNVSWGYPLEDLERLRFECLMDNAIKRSGEDKTKCEEYFINVLKGIKRLDFDRIRANKKTDCITRAKAYAAIGLG